MGRLTDTILPDLTPDNPDDNPREKIEYTAGDRIQAKIDIFGTRTEYSYDNLGRISRERDFFGNPIGNDTTYTYNTGGQVTSVTDARNRTTQIGLDAQGRSSVNTYFDGTTSKVVYDALGRIKSETNQLGQATTYEYDAYGKVSTMIDALNQRTQFTYNSRGSLVKVTDALGHETKYEYDQYNRQTAVIDGNGNRTETTYDQFGQVIAVKDANLHITEYAYDNLGELTAVKLANQATTIYGYDNLGRQTLFEDANGNKTTYEYDTFNRKVATNLALGQRSTTIFNNSGQVANTTDFNGNVITYGYDLYGRLATKSFSDPSVATVGYTYDPVTSQVKTVADGRGVTQYTYDQWDRLQTTIMPDLQSITYGYDVLDNLTSVTTSAAITNYSYDKLNRLDTVKESNRILADYDYDAVGNLTQTKLADGSVETRQYDARNALTQITAKNVTGTVFSSFTYTLDPLGNRTNVIDNIGSRVDYTYDIVNRLTQEKITDATAGNRTIDYSYDLVGNRLNKTDTLEGSTIYSYDANNRLKDTTAGAKVTKFTYDNNGSILTVSDGTNSVVYDWINDGENRLVRVNNGSSLTQYVYDADGNRVASITDGVRTNYLTAPIMGMSEVLMEYDNSGNITTDYTQGLGLIRSRASGRESFYHTDGLGSTRVITDNVGLITNRYNYDAFGVTINQSGTSDNSFQFAGEQRDSATGLDYHRARYYDPGLGRFVSKDDYSGRLNSPITQNPYAYANANPVNFTDPSGYFSLEEVNAAEAISGILSSIPGIALRTVGAIIGGALAAGVFDTARQGYQLIDSAIHGDGRKTDFDVDELLQSVQIGAALGPLLALVPEAALYFAYEGIKSGVAELEAGNIATGVFDILTSLIPLFEEADSKGASNCFVAGTKILTTEGEKNIEDIQVGDWVVSDDPNTPGEIEAKQVTDTFIRQTSGLVDLYVDGEVISTTGEHPFWTPDKGWVEAKDLEVGSFLQTEDGRIIDVDKIEKREGQFQVYNFRVEGFHTYFISDLDILVHNANCAKNAAELRKNMENAGVTFNPGEAAHHIVPSTDGRTQAAINARYTLNSYGIPINDANNGVKLPVSQHNGQGLHRGKTYKAIDLELQKATNKAEAEAILQSIAAKIKAGTFPPP